MKRVLLAALLMLSVISPLAAMSGAAAADNPLKEEMRLLDDAFKNLIDAVIQNRPDRIAEPFHRVHAAKERTEKALHKGKITLPKHGEKLESFVAMDGAFHESLEALIVASRKGDMVKVVMVTHELLDQYVACHTDYRE